jgi:Flp pilus assembly protein TadG
MNVNHRIFEVKYMKTNCFSFVRRLLYDERGQSMVWVGVSLTALLGLSGLTLDVGHAYVVRTQLQSVVNAAALSGVGGLPNTTNVQTAVTTTETNDNNPSWGTVTSPPAKVYCVSAVMPSSQSCASSNILNAVQVTESVSVKTFFMRIFGFTTLPVAATATATPAEARPWIMEFVLDTTPSMASSDSNCTGASTAEECALNGIQGMIGKLNPCPPGTKNCGPSNADIRFGLMSFPNISTSDAPDNYKCSGTVNFQLYSTPAIPASGSTAPYTYLTYGTGSSAVNLTYLSTYGATDMDTNGFYTNWYSATDKSGLNSSSTLVEAIGRNLDSVKPCLQEPNTSNSHWNSLGISTSGVTSFAQAIYAAQTALMAEQAEYPKVNNMPTRTAIIFLSDGQANTLSDTFYPANTAVSSPTINSVASSPAANSGGKSILNTNGLYPSGIDACQQAIMATQYAASLGTRVYTIAYGTEVGGCLYNSSGSGTVNSTILQGKTNGSGLGSDVAITTSNPLVLTGGGNLNVPINSMTDVTPCNTIMDMASDMTFFYSDASQEKSGGSGVNAIDTGCVNPDPNVSALTSLNDIFQAIYGSITSARLIPNNSQ